MAAGLSAQAIQYVESRKAWLPTTRDSSYAMGGDPEGTLRHLYWGAPLWRADDLPAAALRRELSSFDPAAWTLAPPSHLCSRFTGLTAQTIRSKIGLPRCKEACAV
jgi:hypothetical protein